MQLYFDVHFYNSYNHYVVLLLQNYQVAKTMYFKINPFQNQVYHRIFILIAEYND